MFVVTGCTKLSRHADQDSAMAPSEAAPAPAGTVAAMAPGAEAAAGVPVARARALVVTMNLGVVVDDIELAVGKVRGAVERSGGFLANVDSSGAGEQRHARLVLRVPTDQARDMRGTLAALGTVESNTETAVDVTEEHADLQARLANAKVQEERIVQIMKASGGTIADVLVIEAELAKVRGRIEQMEAQRVGLERKIDLATINLDLRLPYAAPKPEAAAIDTPGASIVAAGRAGMLAFQATLLYLAMTLAACFPFLLVAAVVGYGLLRVIRGRRASRAALRG